MESRGNGAAPQGRLVVAGGSPARSAGLWSFYIFSSGGRLNQFGRAEFEGKGIEQRGLLRYLFA